jgi:hypothetical protein
MIMKEEENKYILSQLDKVDDIGEISDGYHTFNSLYNQRLFLFAALVNAYKDKAWKSRLHHDGEPCFGGGWFIVGITTPAGDYTYHYELKDWNLFDCKVLDKAPEWDGHTDKDVTRVLTLGETFDQVNARVIQDNWDKLSQKKGIIAKAAEWLANVMLKDYVVVLLNQDDNAITAVMPKFELIIDFLEYMGEQELVKKFKKQNNQ